MPRSAALLALGLAVIGVPRPGGRGRSAIRSRSPSPRRASGTRRWAAGRRSSPATGPRRRSCATRMPAGGRRLCVDRRPRLRDLPPGPGRPERTWTYRGRPPPCRGRMAAAGRGEAASPAHPAGPRLPGRHRPARGAGRCGGALRLRDLARRRRSGPQALRGQYLVRNRPARQRHLRDDGRHGGHPRLRRLARRRPGAPGRARARRDPPRHRDGGEHQPGEPDPHRLAGLLDRRGRAQRPYRRDPDGGAVRDPAAGRARPPRPRHPGGAGLAGRSRSSAATSPTPPPAPW